MISRSGNEICGVKRYPVKKKIFGRDVHVTASNGVGTMKDYRRLFAQLAILSEPNNKWPLQISHLKQGSKARGVGVAVIIYLFVYYSYYQCQSYECSFSRSISSNTYNETDRKKGKCYFISD